ncbi:MAG TPA: polysaccharide biosynthesis tyrosine autokinase, partial [Solirubrobacteraceae bacterium]
VASRTAKALHLPGGLVGSEVSVSGVGQSNIAQISVTDPDPARAASIANTYAEQYVLYRQAADRTKIAGAQALVQKELSALPPTQRNGSVGTTLENRSNQLGVLAALQTGNAEVAQPAGVPKSPSTPNTKRNAALGVLLGLLLGMGLVFVFERLDRRIRGASELEDAYGIPVLGIVPESDAYEKAGTERLPAVESEAFALLRARLRYFNVDRDVRSLLMTSSAPGEGKTTVALNLAIAEAMSGSGKVVLLEADLRRPSLAKRLGVKGVPGLAEILSRNASFESALREISIPGRTENGNGTSASFSVITAGAVPPNPAELMESRAMIDLLSTLSERFDLVVVDTAPTSAVSDAIPLMRLVSGVVVVNRVDSITRDAARHLREHLAKLHAPVLGVVANAMPAKGRGYYGYGYGYGYSYGYGYGNPYLGEDGVDREERAGKPKASTSSE